MQLFLLDHKRSPPTSHFGTFVVYIVPTANIATPVPVTPNVTSRIHKVDKGRDDPQLRTIFPQEGAINRGE